MTAPETIFDAMGRLLGLITRTPTNRLDLHAPNGVYLGSFDEGMNRTYGPSGLSVGTGNQLSSLLPGNSGRTLPPGSGR